MNLNTVSTRSEAGVLATNKVLKNTYLLLSMTLLFSAAMAGLSMALNLPHLGIIVTMVGYFGLLFLTSKFSNSGIGILCVFALTGFMGLTLGPILNMYLNHFGNGHLLIMTALGGTGVIFLGLSGYALVTRKDFSFMGGFLMVGILVVFGWHWGNGIFHSGLVFGRVWYVHAVDVCDDFIPNQRNYSWRRNQLYFGNRFIVCFPLQFIHGVIAILRHLWWRRISLVDCCTKARCSDSGFWLFR